MNLHARGNPGSIDFEWLDSIGETATIVWRGGAFDDAELEPFELCAGEARADAVSIRTMP